MCLRLYLFTGGSDDVDVLVPSHPVSVTERAPGVVALTLDPETVRVVFVTNTHANARGSTDCSQLPAGTSGGWLVRQPTPPLSNIQNSQTFKSHCLRHNNPHPVHPLLGVGQC